MVRVRNMLPIVLIAVLSVMNLDKKVLLRKSLTSMVMLIA